MRNESVKEILGGLSGGANEELDIPSQFHHVFFMGDMNYRITFDTSEPDSSYAATRKAYLEQKKKDKEEIKNRRASLKEDDIVLDLKEEARAER